jgi:hypothetical protein
VLHMFLLAGLKERLTRREEDGEVNPLGTSCMEPETGEFFYLNRL